MADLALRAFATARRCSKRSDDDDHDHHHHDEHHHHHHHHHGNSGLEFVSHDPSLRGNGTPLDPLGVAITVSAQIRITAHTDAFNVQTYSAQVISLSGGVQFGGLDTSLIPSIAYLKVILTLTTPIPNVERLAIPGIHFPALPPGPLGETVFLAVPPIPLTESDTDASMLMPIFGKGIENTDEIVDVTLDLVVVQR